MADKKRNEKELADIEERITELEREKLEIKARIEALMVELAKETRIDSLTLRKRKGNRLTRSGNSVSKRCLYFGNCS